MPKPTPSPIPRAEWSELLEVAAVLNEDAVAATAEAVPEAGVVLAVFVEEEVVGNTAGSDTRKAALSLVQNSHVLGASPFCNRKKNGALKSDPLIDVVFHRRLF